MIDIKELEHLAPMANEMLSGLHADEAMKRRILFAANEKTKRRAPMPRLVPALCCAALAIACVSAFAPRLSGTAVDAAATPMPVSIDSIAAGGEQAAPMTRVADVSGTARVRAATCSSTPACRARSSMTSSRMNVESTSLTTSKGPVRPSGTGPSSSVMSKIRPA